MKYDTVIFDLDGTLLDTLDDLKDSLNFALKKEGLPERTKAEVKKFVGNGIRKLIERGVGENVDITIIDKVHNEFTKHYKEHCADKTKAYDKIIPLLKKLKENNVKTAVVSNKADYAVGLLCHRYFNGLLDLSVGEKENVRRKPYPDSLNEVLKYFNISKEKAVYIGDSEVDIQTAENAGINSIIVTWGFREKEFLRSCGAKDFADTPEELSEKIFGY